MDFNGVNQFNYIENLTFIGTGNFTGIGNANDNVITGGAGNDLLIGRAGTDTLVGGAGNDVFVYRAGFGNDTIADFTKGEDKIKIGNVVGVTSGNVLSYAQQSGANVVFTFNGETLTLLNVKKANLSASDFDLNGFGSAPGDIKLSNTSLAETSAWGTVVGTLSASDADLGDTFTYEIINRPDGMFTIVDNSLLLTGSLDYEGFSSQQVTIRTTNSANQTFDKTFTINVTDVEELYDFKTST